jgi:hypothetical protein
MYKVTSIEPHIYFEDSFNVWLNDDFGGSTHTVLKGSHEVTLLSRWPKDVKDFNLDQHVFKTVRDLQVNDEIASY